MAAMTERLGSGGWNGQLCSVLGTNLAPDADNFFPLEKIFFVLVVL